MDNVQVTISSLKKELKSLKDELNSCEVGSLKFMDLAKQVAVADGKIKDINLSIKDVSKSDFSKIAAAGSTIAAGFTAAQGALNLFGILSNAVIQSMAKMQALMGLTLSLDKLKAGFGAAGGAAKTFKTALSALAAHPIIAVIAGVVIVIKKIVDAIKQNEAAVYRLKEAFAPLNGVMNVFKNALDVVTDLVTDLAVKLAGPLTKGILTVIKWIAKGAEALGMDGIAGALNQIEETSRAEQEIAKENLDLLRERRRVAEENAQMQVHITELETDFVKATGDEIKLKKIAAQIEAEQLKIKENNYNLAKREYEQIVKINAQTQSGQRDLDAETEAKVKMLNAQAEFNRLSKESTRLARQEGKDAEKAAKDADKKNNIYDLMISKIKATTDLEIEANKQILEVEKQRLSTLEEGSKEYYDLQVKIKELEKKLVKDQYTAELDELERKNTAEITELLMMLNNKEISYLEYDERIKKIDEDYKQNYILTLQELLELDTLNVELRAELLEKLKQASTPDKDAGKLNKEDEELLKKIIRYAQEEDGQWAHLQKMQQLIDEALDKRLISEETYTEASKRLAKEKAKYEISMAVTAATGIADILSSIADMQDKNNQEGFERSKKLQIAAATINMLAGITAAIAGTYTTHTGWWDWALMAVQAASIAASGGATIANIKKLTYNGGSTSTPSASSVATTIIPPVQYSSAVQGADTQKTISNTKAYVTVEEINKVGTRVDVAENEARY